MYDFMQLFAPHLSRELVDDVFAARDKSEMESLFENVVLPLR